MAGVKLEPHMTIFLLFQIATLAIYGDCASVTTCQNSYQCGQDMCCRATDGTLITDQQMHGGFGPIMMQPNQNGTCSTRLAQKNEICDSNCDCDVGLACYRPMSGVCCPPMRCYDAAYVKQQQEYWSKCMSTPGCALPP